MAKTDMNSLLKRRMTATQQASELQASDEAYQQIFREKVPASTTELCDLPLDKLIPFLIQRQGLSIVERGKAYKALLEAKNRKGQRFDLIENATSGDNRPRYSARALVAEFFGVTEYEIRKAIKLGSARELEKLFLEFLRERVKIS